MTNVPSSLPHRLAAEFFGSAFLAAIVTGFGIATQRQSPSDTGLELLENSAAAAAGLLAIILMFGPVSGPHFSPVVSLAGAALGGGIAVVAVTRVLYPGAYPRPGRRRHRAARDSQWPGTSQSHPAANDGDARRVTGRTDG